ncbi:MAG: hypothetical protein Q7S03_03075 [bacterium]|nr:hypothetical protein [bacterium]
MSSQQSNQNLDLSLEIINRKLELQVSAHTSLEAKIGILFGFVGVITAGAIALMQGRQELIGRNFLTLGLICLGITLLLLILASRTRTFLDPPDFSTFYSQKSLNNDGIEFKNQIVSDMIESYKRNALYHLEKARLYDGALWTFLGSLILIFIGIL